MDGFVNKVYINPNFKPHAQNPLEPQANVMHINPAFSQHVQRIVDVQQKSKIHFNPNFIRPNENICYKLPSNEDNTYKYLNTPSSSTGSVVPTKMSSPAISNTRYSLVRREHKKKIDVSVVENPKTTITLSKYKSIALKDWKKRIDVISHHNMQTKHLNEEATEIVSKFKNKYKVERKNVVPLTEIDNRKLNRITDTPSVYTNKFKLVKQNLMLKAIERNKRLASYRKATRTIVKKLDSSKSRFKMNTIIGKLKKNNIPCPLFKKYGKCLRREHGTCDFLHDKKHVTICRKFIKGLCHNEDCSLSHDVSSNKMPTCHFYLKGVCTKVDCPYLHVKLDDNATVCADFLKGYCELGGACSKRHIHICPDVATKGICCKKPCTYQHKVQNKKVKRTFKQSATYYASTCDETKTLSKIEDHNTEQDKVKDNRYYKESLDTNDICEIKPSRCKIGKLPSFIQL